MKFAIAILAFFAFTAPALAQSWSLEVYTTTLPIGPTSTIKSVTISYACSSGKKIPVTVDFNRSQKDYPDRDSVVSASATLVTAAQLSDAQKQC